MGQSLAGGVLDVFITHQVLADLEAATVKVTAAYSKHRRDDILPLRRDMAEAVAVFIAARPADARLFAVPPRTAEMIQTDLAAAREAWIKAAGTKQEREARRTTAFLADADGSGRVVDFHALQHTFITRLARSGVVPAVAKSLARHSTIVLTMDHYTHTLIEDEWEALDRLGGVRYIPAQLPPASRERPAEGRSVSTPARVSTAAGGQPALTPVGSFPQSQSRSLPPCRRPSR